MPETNYTSAKSSPKSSSGLLIQILTALVIVYLMVALFPGIENANYPGLDKSWIYALSHLPQTDYSFGKDVFFTYGPLGYLLIPSPVGDIFARTMIFLLAAHLLLGVLLFLHWRVTSNRLGVLIFTTVYLLLNMLSFVNTTTLEIFSDYYLIMICGLAFSLGLKREKWLAFSLTICALISSLQVFMKFNTGAAATAQFFVAVAVVFIRSPAKRKTALTAVAIYLITFLTLSLVLIGGPGRIATWFRASLEIASEFSAAMSIAGARFGLLEWLATFAVFLTLTAWLLLKKSTAGLVALCTLPVMLATFKSGFVRQDSHEMVYFLAISLVMCLIVVCVERTNELVAAVIAFLLVFAVTTDAKQRWWGPTNWTAQASNILSLKPGMMKIGRLMRLKQWEKSLAEQSHNSLSSLRLPDGWLDNVDRQRQTFDVVPTEINYCPANDLKWNPTPTLQSYVAYTDWLDNLNAGHFRGQNSPDFVLVSYYTIDYRHLLWDTPSTWRMLLNNYEIAQIKPEANLMMLKRKPVTSEPEWQTVGETVIAPFQWQTPPESDGLIFAQMNLLLTLSGRFRKTALRLPPVMIEVEYADGTHTEFRVMPKVAANGLLLNYLPTDLLGLERLFKCQAVTPVRRFRLMGRGANFLTQAIKVTWKKETKPCGVIAQPTN